MGRLIRYVFFLAILVFLGLVGFSYFGDLSAVQTEVTIVVEPNAG